MLAILLMIVEGVGSTHKLGLVDHGSYDVLWTSNGLVELPTMQLALGASLWRRFCHVGERSSSMPVEEAIYMMNACF